MIILWQPEYFDSLACVHEFASFLHVHKDSRKVQFVPVCMPSFTVALFLFHTCATIALVPVFSFLVASREHIDWVHTEIPFRARYGYFVAVMFVVFCFGVYLVPSFFLWKFARTQTEQRRRLREQLSTFSVARSRCFLEAHREALVADIAEQFGSVTEFETFIRTGLPQRIDILRRAPVPLLTAMVGAISPFLFMTTLVTGFLRAGDTSIAAHGMIVLPLLWICTDSLALNLVMLLAGCRHKRAHGRRELLGPLASAMIFAGLTACSMGVMFPVLPLWGAVLVLLAMLSAVAALYRRDYAPVGERGAAAVSGEEPGEERRAAP